MRIADSSKKPAGADVGTADRAARLAAAAGRCVLKVENTRFAASAIRASDECNSLDAMSS